MNVHHFLYYALEAFLELTLIFRARDQGTHVKGIDFFRFQIFRHLPVHNVLGDALRDGGLAHAGLAHQDGVVLGSAGKNLQNTADFIVPANHGVQFALGRALVQVDGKALQKAVVVIVFCHSSFLLLHELWQSPFRSRFPAILAEAGSLGRTVDATGGEVVVR